MIPKFHIGQKVVTVKDCMFFKKGQIFIIESISKSICRCPYFTYNIGISTEFEIVCVCGMDIKPGVCWFDEPYFAPVIEEKDFVAITFEKVLEEQLSSVN